MNDSPASFCKLLIEFWGWKGLDWKKGGKMKRVGLFFIVMIVGLMVVLIYNKLVVIEVTDDLSD